MSRKRSTIYDPSLSIPGIEEKVGTLTHFAIIWNRNDEWTEDSFTAARHNLEKWLRSISTQWVFQLERGELNGRLHYQGQVTTSKKWTLLQLKLDATSLCPMIYLQPCSKLGREGLMKYCQKSNTRLQGPWAEGCYIGQDLFDAPRLWQQKIMTMTETKPDPRKILTIVDEKGGSGKTALTKYLAFHSNAIVLGWGQVKDLLFIAATATTKRLFIFDLQRTHGKWDTQKEVFAAVESIKNGCICSTKYESKMVTYEIPHVMVFMNELPKLELLSKDRWSLYCLEDNELTYMSK